LKDNDGNTLGQNNTRVISINSNICYNYNWYGIVQFQDPGHMLDWLQKQLHDLEKVNGSAIIVTHLPNIDECLRQYGRRYHAIVDRYQTVIRWSMAGHIHREQYQVVTDMISKDPIGMNFIVGAVTPYQGKAPSFNVIYIDPDLMIPVDYESWLFDLDKANELDTPIWYRKYNYRETYNLEDLSPKSFMEHSLKIYRNETAAI
jgi:sphingomyelin phosphodiesterase